MQIRVSTSEKGIALVAVVVCILIFTIFSFSVLNVVNGEISMVQNTVRKTKAFYLAEAGLELFSIKLNNAKFEGIEETTMGQGSCRVDYYPESDPPYAVSTGTVDGQEKKIKVTVSFLASPYECAVYAGGLGGTPWTLMLRGTGNPIASGWPLVREVGGKDRVNGNIFVKGDVALYQQSSVNPPSGSNPFSLDGDVTATGGIDLYDSATITGDVNEGVKLQDPPDLVGMKYAENNTHNVSQIFTEAGITKGYLPKGHPLRDVFMKNPDDRNAECVSTKGNDYFFEPSSGFVTGGPHSGDTPLHAGDDRVYYIDGDVWVHSKPTYGFKMDGKVTIVATGDIHVCDNLEYKDSSSMLGLVALGKYDNSGNLISGGNVYFGDPEFGNMGVFSAMMFAAKDFLYNTDGVTGKLAEPDSGFTLNGNLAAMNTVSIERDWYTPGNSKDATAKPARYDFAAGKWVDFKTGKALDTTEISGMRHYQMILNYDDRVRTRTTQPPGLPKGKGLIFEGLRNWKELAPGQMNMSCESDDKNISGKS